jgi:hypothetical protein
MILTTKDTKVTKSTKVGVNLSEPIVTSFENTCAGTIGATARPPGIRHTRERGYPG